MTNYIDAKHFLIGAAVGGLLGSVTALLLAPQSGSELRRELSHAYDSLSDKTQDLAKKMGCQTCDWASKAKMVVDGASKTVKKWVGEEEEEQEEQTSSSTAWLIGTFAGALVGAVTGLLLAPKAGEDLRNGIVNTYEEISTRGKALGDDISRKGREFAKSAGDQGNKWINFAQNLLDDLANNNQETSENLIEKAKCLLPNRRAHDAIDLASIGLRLWRDISAKR